MHYAISIMTVWTQLSEIIARLPEAVTSLIDSLVEAVRGTVGSEARRQIAFTASMIALAAKMAKADGVVTSDEVEVVRRLFVVPEAERRNVARLFNLAKQDVAGYEAYAGRIRRLFDDDPAMLEDILDGLFVIAAADGHIHEDEVAFLRTVSSVFEVPRPAFARIMARHVKAGRDDPYAVLGIPPGSDPQDVKRAWRRLVSEHHPDRLHARGLPADLIRVATERVAAINAAYASIVREPA